MVLELLSISSSIQRRSTTETSEEKIDEDLREFANAERVAQLNNELSNAAMERQIQYEVARLANQQALNRQALTAQLLNQVGPY